MSDSARKEFRELEKIVSRKGFKVVPGSGHKKIIDVEGRLGPRGAKVVDENGPVILSTSPGDFRARDLAAARLIRAGVLEAKDLPWKPEKAKRPEGLLLGDEEPPDPRKLTRAQRIEREKQAERDKKKGEQRTRHERTQAIRGDLEPLVAKLGGWGKRGLVGELADVVYHFTKGTSWGFPSVAAARSSATNLRGGGTLSDDRCTSWESLVEALLMADQDGKLREAWYDLVRSARGLPPRSQPVIAYRASVVEPDRDGRPLLQPETGALNEEMQRHYGDGSRPGWPEGEPHPLLEMHEDGGVRWPVDFTIDDLNGLNEAVGIFEVLALTLTQFDGNGLAAPAVERTSDALARVRTLVEKAGEARFRNLAARGQVDERRTA